MDPSAADRGAHRDVTDPLVLAAASLMGIGPTVTHVLLGRWTAADLALGVALVAAATTGGVTALSRVLRSSQWVRA